jgi:hypothetical protein
MKGFGFLVALIILALGAVGCSNGASQNQATATPNIATTQARIGVAIQTSQARSAIATKTQAAAQPAATPRATTQSQAGQPQANTCAPNMTESKETGAGRTASFQFTIPRCHVPIIGGETVDGASGVLRAIEGTGQQVNVTIADGFYTIVPDARGQAEWCQRLAQAKPNSNVQPLPQWKAC